MKIIAWLRHYCVSENSQQLTPLTRHRASNDDSHNWPTNAPSRLSQAGSARSQYSLRGSMWLVRGGGAHAQSGLLEGVVNKTACVSNVAGNKRTFRWYYWFIDESTYNALTTLQYNMESIPLVLLIQQRPARKSCTCSIEAMTTFQANESPLLQSCSTMNQLWTSNRLTTLWLYIIKLVTRIRNSFSLETIVVKSQWSETAS